MTLLQSVHQLGRLSAKYEIHIKLRLNRGLICMPHKAINKETVHGVVSLKLMV